MSTNETEKSPLIGQSRSNAELGSPIVATKSQIERAARLFRLALVAHMDMTGDYSQEVREAAVRQARHELDRLGYDYGILLSETDCLRAAMAPNEKLTSGATAEGETK